MHHGQANAGHEDGNVQPELENAVYEHQVRSGYSPDASHRQCYSCNCCQRRRERRNPSLSPVPLPHDPTRLPPVRALTLQALPRSEHQQPPAIQQSSERCGVCSLSALSAELARGPARHGRGQKTNCCPPERLHSLVPRLGGVLQVQRGGEQSRSRGRLSPGSAILQQSP